MQTQAVLWHVAEAANNSGVTDDRPPLAQGASR
jgi:hypothetical protein